MTTAVFRLLVLSRVPRLPMLAATALLALSVAGCASNQYREAKRLIDQGKPEEALPKLEQAVKDNPRNTEYRAALLRERERLSSEKLVQADAALRAGRLDDAEAAYRRAREIDPEGYRPQGGLAEVERARRHAKLIEEAATRIREGNLTDAESRLRAVLNENPGQPQARALMRQVVEANMAGDATPQLKVPFRKPITLEFRDAQIKTVFEMLSRTSGINFVFDRDVKQDQKVTVYVRNSSLDDILKLILTTNQLERKILNENSVLIYPNTPAKQKDYKELVVRSFYLANADVKQAQAMVKALVKTQDVFIDEKLNLMVVKDTPEVVRLTDQLVRTLDLAEPEVMLEVEVLEVTRTRIQELGIRYPDAVTLRAPTTGTGTASAISPIDGPKIFTITDPALTFNLRANVGRTNILANPRIRVKNKEKARIHIGDKVPVFTTTSTANVGVSTSVSYLDVGLKLDVEPQVYLQDEVAIRMGLEVSNIIETVNVNNSVAYRLGTRNTNTVLQLRDGETQILAGLINDEDRSTANRIPGLGDLPILSRIFGTQQDNKAKTEIVLLITPRIVRNIARPDGLMAELPVGTDTFPGLPPLRIARTESGALTVITGSAGESLVGAAAILLSLPAQAAKGAQVPVSVKLAESIGIRAGYVDLTYDPAVLEPVNAKVKDRGRITIDAAKLERTAFVVFRAVGDPGATTTVAVSDVELIDAAGGLAPVATLPGATFTVVANP
ncbi:MAG: tetratricopeptide repeat protein [Burkholderiales bacterium]|nr:tetratricopeptide repeat protein [Burkholderiales bacterium]